MTEQLKTMLRDAADDHPDLTLHGDPWRHGRRIRLRRRLAGAAGVAVTATALVAGTVLLTTPDLSTTPEPAQEEPAEPALPDTLYEVPPNIPDIGEDPLGEPAAIVYASAVRTSIFAEEDRPVVVGAESGTVRAIDDAGQRDHFLLSPDGRQLAIARPLKLGIDHDQPGVLIVNVVTGESIRHELPDDGRGVESLAWAPNGSSLTITILKPTGVSNDGTPVSFEQVPKVLDVRTGTWREEGFSNVLALSHDGQRLVVSSVEPAASVLHDADGLDAVRAALDTRFGVAFSPDSRMVAGISGPISDFSPPDPYELKIVDAQTGDETMAVELGDYADARLIGWGERGILVHTTTAGESTTSVVELIGPTDQADPARTTVIEDRSESVQIGIAAAFVDADIRETAPPDAPFDWSGLVPDPVLLGFVAAVALIVIMMYRNRRVRSGRGSATVRGSTGR